MLSDNIRNNRKKINLSQEELAEKVGVSRQSVSFWETGQTQPTIDNIIALSKIFNISSDMLLENYDDETSIPDELLDYVEEEEKKEKKQLIITIIIISIVIAVIIGAVVILILSSKGNSSKGSDFESSDTKISAVITEEASSASSSSNVQSSKQSTSTAAYSKPATGSVSSASTQASSTATTQIEENFDLFSYCKEFAIEKGQLNGDYCIYQQPATTYGGYDNEYFSISYWSDSDMVEFCLHCPLDDTYSHNFYLRMRGGYNKKYEYLSSKYFRNNGESLRSATGYIDPTVFSDSYPISCDNYEGSTDGQNEFMEQSRIGVCDLIRCLKKFVTVENMECDFSDFDFVNF